MAELARAKPAVVFRAVFRVRGNVPRRPEPVMLEVKCHDFFSFNSCKDTMTQAPGLFLKPGGGSHGAHALPGAPGAFRFIARLYRAGMICALLMGTLAAPSVEANNELVEAMIRMMHAMGFNVTPVDAVSSMPAASMMPMNPGVSAMMGQPLTTNPMSAMNPLAANPAGQIQNWAGPSMNLPTTTAQQWMGNQHPLPQSNVGYPAPGSSINAASNSPNPLNFGYSGTAANHPQASSGSQVAQHPLNGLWEGTNGEQLILYGNQFRIQVADQRQMDGYFRFDDERIYFYNSQEQMTNSYDFAYYEDRLVLRDANEQLMLFRRIANY